MENLRNHGGSNPKLSFYQSDGTGRDEYISVNSGGFIAPNPKPDIFVRKSLALPQKTQYFMPSPRLNSPILRYYSDGSGRDYYIVHNSGGLHTSVMSERKKDPFKEGLRQYPRINRSKPDVFTRTMNSWINPKMKEHEKKRQETVKTLVQRLYHHNSAKTLPRITTTGFGSTHNRKLSTQGFNKVT